ncbi:MAG: DUF3558 family protein [Aeromicrobium sp.]
MRKSLATGAVLLMCALGACSSGSGGSDDAPSGDKPDSSKDSAAVFDPCKEISLDEAKAVLGYDVVMTEGPGSGCTWGNEENPRLASFSVNTTGDADVNGGIEGAKSGTTALIDGEPTDITGLADGAFVVFGPLKGGGGESIQAQGAILDGDQLIFVGITQLGGADVTQDEVAAQAEAGMKLVGSKL